jgi:hypothetical protein
MSSMSTAVADTKDDGAVEVLADDGGGGPPLTRRKRLGRWCVEHPVMAAVIVAVFVRAAIAIGIYIVNGGALFGDETTYTGLAWSKAEGTTGWWDPFISRLYWGTSTFTVPMTLLFDVFGPKTIVGQLIAVAYATAAAGFTTVVAKHVVRPTLALFAGLVVALLPSQVLFSVLVLKDSAAWFAAAALAYAVVRIARSTGRDLLRWAAVAGVLLFLLGHVRDHSTVVAAWALLVASFFPSSQRLLRIAAVGAVAVLVPIQCGIGPVGITLVLNHGDLDERRADNAEGANTAFVPDATARDLQEATEARTEVEQVAVAEETESQTLDQQADVAEAEAVAAAVDAGLPAPSLEPNAPTTTTTAPTNAQEAARQERAVQLQREAQRLREEATRAAEEAEIAKAELAAARSAEERALARVEKSPASTLGGLFGEGGGKTSSSLSALPIGLRVMILDPLPFLGTDNSRVRMAMGEMLLWYPLLGLGLIGLVAGRRRLADLTFPTLVAGGTFLMYALSEGNFGTAFRHRGETVWAVAILAAVGLEALLRRRDGLEASLPSIALSADDTSRSGS